MRPLRTALALALLSAVCIAPARAHDEHAASRASLLTKVRELLDAGDSFAAAEHVQDGGTPLVVAGRYGDVCGDLYWKAKDLDASLTIGRAAILYCLTKSREVENEAQSRRLRVIAQEISFDMASFAWPGWDEKGIEIGPEQLREGLDCARLDLRLVTEMDYPPEKHANAHWIVGAQLLAAGRHADARAAFEASQSNAMKAEDPTKQWMAAGYAAMAAHLADRENADAKTRLDEAVKQLETIATDDSKYLAGQLHDVLKVFSR